MDSAIKKLMGLIRKDTAKPSGTDYTATVTRVDGNTAYVQMTGADINDTPVAMTINANVGDQVRVRVANGKAWITGSDSAPPTDDTTAKTAVKQVSAVSKIVNVVKAVAERAARIAGNTAQYFWVIETGTDTGAHITEIPQEQFLADPDNGGGNLLARSNGIAVRDGLTELAAFSAGGLDVTTYDSNGNAVEIAHLGYGEGAKQESGTAYAPYYTLGTRGSGAVGNYSVAEGLGVIASGYASHATGHGSQATRDWADASGLSTLASGYYSHAQNLQTVAASEAQTAIGKNNIVDANNAYAFIIGNGSGDDARSNALVVSWDGYIECTGIKFGDANHRRTLLFEVDGNMALYDSGGNLLWQSGTGT